MTGTVIEGGQDVVPNMVFERDGNEKSTMLTVIEGGQDVVPKMDGV